jgi:hypothetical protein
MKSPNAWAYNQINATIIRIGIAQRERGCDPEYLGTRITWFRVTVGKVWRFEVAGTKLEFHKKPRGYLQGTEIFQEFSNLFYKRKSSGTSPRTRGLKE